MAHRIFVGMIILSIAYGVGFGRAGAVAEAAMAGAATAVELILSMAGAYMLWMGLMEIGRQSGLNEWVARGIGKMIRPLFPGVKKDGESMAAISLNIAANFLGMGNAATPFGLKAMERMHRVQKPKKATNEMIMLIVINCSSVLLIPTSIIALLAAAGSQDPFAITLPVIIATTATTLTGVVAAWLMGRGKR
ncbi:hypothetical protein LJC20_07030 [Eubacteriales bacterium OttesenSCG-928-M02]|nr:hypothetical protein [Eubacteriales bacterium OttesenSCG-928-M02]